MCKAAVKTMRNYSALRHIIRHCTDTLAEETLQQAVLLPEVRMQQGKACFPLLQDR